MLAQRDLREDLRLPLDTCLNPIEAFALLKNVDVQPFRDIPVAKVFLDRIRASGARICSGFALPLPGGAAVVAYNDQHSSARTRATLMEEFFHLRLGHPPSVIRLLDDNGSSGRSHDRAVEHEAYSSGAAALVPYKSLRAHVEGGHSTSSIANVFGVSADLVAFRMKVTKLWGLMRRRHKGA